MWRLLYKEYKPDTATRKAGLLERAMDDEPAAEVDFSDWFLRWLDLVGDCDQARVRINDDDIKVAMMRKRSPKKLRDHLVLESPRLASVENKLPVVREPVQHWSPQWIAAVSSTAGDSGTTVSALGWYGSWHEKGHGKGKNGENGKEKCKGKGKGKKKQEEG